MNFLDDYHTDISRWVFLLAYKHDFLLRVTQLWVTQKYKQFCIKQIEKRDFLGDEVRDRRTDYICEMKFSEHDFTIDKSYETELANKIDAFSNCKQHTYQDTLHSACHGNDKWCYPKRTRQRYEPGGYIG